MKTRINLNIIFLLFLSSGLRAQAPSVAWLNVYNPDTMEYYDIKQTADGGYIVAGDSYIQDNKFDFGVMKLDSSGNFEWTKHYGGSTDDIAYSVYQTFDGGYIIAGYTNSTDGDVTGNSGGDDYWVIKLDTLGNLEWQKCYGSTIIPFAYGDRYEYASVIKQTPDSGYIVLGKPWLIKIDVSGNIVWQEDISVLFSGGSFFPTSLYNTFDGGYVIAGYSWSTLSWEYGRNDYWIIKVDSLGNEQWEKHYGGSENDFAYSIQQTVDSGYIVAGCTKSTDKFVVGNHGYYDFWIVKLNPSGGISWKKCYGGSVSDQAFSIIQTVDTGYVIAGYTDSDDGDVEGNDSLYNANNLWILKIDASGAIKWQKLIPDLTDFYLHGAFEYDIVPPMSICQTTDNGVVIAGGNFNTTFYSFVLKLNDSPDFIGFGKNILLSVYPNPAQDYLFTEAGDIKSVRIYDIMGNEIIEKINAGKHSKLKVGVGMLPSGIYLVKVETDKGTAVRKFVKE